MAKPEQLKSDAEVEQLKAEISENQAELQQTVAAIQDRLNPAHLKDRAAATVREATIGRMQHMMNSNNPVPYALIGIGAAWLLARQRSSGRWRQGNGGSWGQDRHYGSTTSMSDDERFTSPAEGRSMASDWQSAASERAAAVSDQAAAMTDRARRAAGEARYKLSSTLNKNPMALGIAALAAGALVGSVLPVTETENEYLGEVRDNAVESAKSLVHDTVQKATGSDESV